MGRKIRMQKIMAVIFILAVFINGMITNAAPVDYGAEIPITSDNAYRQSFSDVPVDHWAFKYIEELVERGAINGYPDGKFRPDLKVTRAEFAKIMTIAAGLPLKTITKSSFSDIKPSDWYIHYVEAAKDYMTGYRNSVSQILFKPDAYALREDIVVAMVKLKGYDIRFADQSMLKAMFKDYESISTSARSYVAIAVENGLISGFPDDTFRAQATITRAEVATILWRAFQYGNDDKVVDNIPEPTEAEQSTQETITTSDTPEENENTPEDNESLPDLYSVKTLALNIKSMESLIVNNRDDVYFLQDNKIKKIENGKVITIADGDSDFVRNVSKNKIAAHIIDRIDNDFVINELSEYQGDNDDVISFEKFNISRLIYDKNLDKVYAFGYYQNDWYNNINNQFVTYAAIYDINELDNPLAEYFTASNVYLEIDSLNMFIGTLAFLENGTLMYGGRNDQYLYRFDLDSNNITSFSDATTGAGEISVLGKINSTYYIIDPFLSSLSLLQYDYTNAQWKEKTLKTSQIKDNISATTFKDSMFYFTSGANIYSVGNDGKINDYITSDVLNISDSLPMGIITNMVVDINGSVIFYDSTNKAIRIICK